jgi:FlaA1/EpsC-like NDP-sugar epimerase
MGQPVKIKQIAKKLSDAIGVDLNFEYIGLSQGEKMTEELYTEEELSKARDFGPFWNAKFQEINSSYAIGLMPPASDAESIMMIDGLLNDSKQ